MSLWRYLGLSIWALAVLAVVVAVQLDVETVDHADGEVGPVQTQVRLPVVLVEVALCFAYLHRGYFARAVHPVGLFLSSVRPFENFLETGPYVL